MSSFDVGFLMGSIAGAIVCYVLVVVHAWWDARPKRLEYDPTVDRIRRLHR